jgi:hypothetical protein
MPGTRLRYPPAKLGETVPVGGLLSSRARMGRGDVGVDEAGGGAGCCGRPRNAESRRRKPSRRELAAGELMAEIHAARDGYRRVYGVRKTWRELRRRGIDGGRDRGSPG